MIRALDTAVLHYVLSTDEGNLLVGAPKLYVLSTDEGNLLVGAPKPYVLSTDEGNLLVGDWGLLWTLWSAPECPEQAPISHEKISFICA